MFSGITKLTVCLGLENMRGATGGPSCAVSTPPFPPPHCHPREQRSPTWKYFCQGQRSLLLNLSGKVCPLTENTTCNERNEQREMLAHPPAGSWFESKRKKISQKIKNKTKPKKYHTFYCNQLATIFSKKSWFPESS